MCPLASLECHADASAAPHPPTAPWHAQVGMDLSGGVQARGLPQLLALYRFLDYDGDGWITHDDFVLAVTEATIDENSSDGPRLPVSSVRGGPQRGYGATAANRITAMRARRSSLLDRGGEVRRPRKSKSKSKATAERRSNSQGLNSNVRTDFFAIAF
jgi:hypothetical protein